MPDNKLHSTTSQRSTPTSVSELCTLLSEATGISSEKYSAFLERAASRPDTLDAAAAGVVSGIRENSRSMHHANKPGIRDKMLQAAMLSYLADGMVVIDSERQIFIINKRAKEILGLSPDDCNEDCAYDSVLKLRTRAGERLPFELDPIAHTLETGTVNRVTFMDDVYCEKPDGKLIPVTISASPIIFNGATQGAVVIFDDVTEEKKLDEIKSDFIYIASHQLRTPLTVSTLHAEMLLAGHGGELSKEQREFISEIHFYNKKMAQLLSVFMTVSKIELGTFVMQYKPTDLLLVMEDVMHELGTQIKNKKIRAKLNYADGLSSVETDPEFIRIVFQNLLSNAVKYTPHEGSISISLERKGSRAVVTVADSGCGIPLNEQSQVFSKLYRGTNTKNHRWESNGLGLYITKSIIDKCGGSISFTSEENKGTTFAVRIPVKAPETAHGTISMH